MTTHQRHYCKHCGIAYSFQGSGWGAGEYNNSEYCPECYEAVHTALSKIPLKVGKKFIPTTDFTKEQFLEEFEKLKATPTESGFPRAFRTWITLFDLKDPDNHNYCIGLNLKATDKDKKYLYRMSWWSKKPEYTLEKEVTWDIVNNKILENY
jgi:hypothetical protein